MSRVFRIAVVFLAAVLLTIPAFGDDAPTAAGQWKGEIEVPGGLEVIVDLAEIEDDWAGQIAIPVQGLEDFPLADVEVADGKVGFAMDGVPGRPEFEGRLSADGTTISGDFSQGGGTVPFSLTRQGDTSFQPTGPIQTSEELLALAGTWRGKLEIPGQTLRMELSIAEGEGDILDVRFGSPDQGNTDMRPSRLERDGRKVVVGLDFMNARFEGELDEAGDVMTGTWYQGGGSLPLVLDRDREE